MKKTSSILLMAIFSLILFNLNLNGQDCIYCNSNTVGDSSSAIGAENVSTGMYSFASGYQCEASGDFSTGFGDNSKAIAKSSFAGGSFAEANGVYSVSLGRHTLANGQSSVAIGKYVLAHSTSSVAIGTFLADSSSFSITLGTGFDNDKRLVNRVSESLVVGFNSTHPTFFVGASNGQFKTGKIGIGNITAPEAKLHIKADDDEDASIFLQPTSSSYHGKLLLGDENHTISSKTGENLEFKTETDKDFVFKNGSIFIEDSFEGLVLKSPDGQCWKGTIDDNGSFAFESIDCNLITSNDKTLDNKLQTVRIFPNPAGKKLNIEIPVEMQQAFVAIYNEQGILLQQKEIHGGNNPISLKKMVHGILVVKVVNAAGEVISVEKVLHK